MLGMLQFTLQPMSDCPIPSWEYASVWCSLTQRSTVHPDGLWASAESEGWNLRWRKLLGKGLICSNSLLYGFNNFYEYISEILQDLGGEGGVMYLLCISSGLEIVLNYPIQCFSYIALSWNYSLLSMEPKALLSRFPERSSRYHGANRTFGSD